MVKIPLLMVMFGDWLLPIEQRKVLSSRFSAQLRSNCPETGTYSSSKIKKCPCCYLLTVHLEGQFTTWTISLK